MSYSVVIGLKVVSSAITMLFYLNNKFKYNYKFIPLSNLYSSISYDRGWYVYIDGKQIKTFKLLDSLLGFKITELVFYH